MATKIIFIILSLVLVVVNISCDSITYSPEEKHHVNVVQPKANLSINLNSSEDTIFVCGITDFKYTIDTKGKIFSRVLVYLDSLLVGTSEDESLYTLNTERFPNGTHTLNLQVWVYSGSGSLADKSKSEFLVSSKAWPIFIDNREYTEPIKIDSIYPSNGRLRIQWKKYPYYNFKYYTIYKAFVSNGSSSDFYPYGTIYNRDQNYWNDADFLGGACKYKIVATASNKTIPGEEKLFKDESMFLYPIEKKDNDKIVLKWKRCKYFANLKNYSLYRIYTTGNINGDERGDLIASIQKYTDTTYVDTPAFGTKSAYYLYASGSGYSSSERSNTIAAGIGNEIPSFGNFDFIPEVNSIYLGNRRLDASTLQEMARNDYAVYLSRDGKYAYTNGGSTNNTPVSITKLDPLSLQKIGSTVNTESVIGYQSIVKTISVLSNGYCLYLGNRYKEPTEYGPPALVIIGIDPAKLILKDSVTLKPVYADNEVIISKNVDGVEYALIGNYLSKIKDNKISVLKRFNNYLSGYCFTPDGDKYIISKNGGIEIYRCSNNWMLNSFFVSGDLCHIMVDPATGYLGGVDLMSNKYKIFDLNSGKLIKEIKVGSNWGLYFANSYLFSQNGFYMKLDFQK